MILAKNNVPDVYTESEDFLSVLRLLDLVSNSEHCMNKINKVVDPLLCPYEYLPHLAKRMGYDYDTSIPVKDNKIIMSSFPQMMKNKGNVLGFEIAVKTSIKLSDHVSKAYTGPSPYVITYDRTNNKMIISIVCKKFSKKLHDLIEYIRPVGMEVNIKTMEYESIEHSGLMTFSDSYNKYYKPKIIIIDEKNSEMNEIFDIATEQEENGETVIKYTFAIKNDNADRTEQSKIKINKVEIHAKVLIGNSINSAEDICFSLESESNAFKSYIYKENGERTTEWDIFGSVSDNYGIQIPKEAEQDTKGYHIITLKLKLNGEGGTIFGGLNRGYIYSKLKKPNLEMVESTYQFNEINK